MNINDYKPKFETALERLKEELATLRTGRTSPSVVENIMVESYGAKMPLLQLASINSPEPRQLVVQPWDASNLKAIEKAINEANLGFSVVIQEKMIRLNAPMLTEERRNEIVKNLKEILEKIKVSLRQVREKAREEIGQMEKNKEISEDEKYRSQEELDKITHEYTEKIEELGEKKKQEIMTV